MPLIYADRVKETTTTTGTGTLTLAGAASGHQSFAAVGNANTCVYGLEASDGAWEVGIGTYTLSGTTLARTTILASSNAGAAITLPAGTHNVYVTADASRVQSAYESHSAITPGGRLTLTTGVPVTTDDVTGATTVYYTPYVHDRIALWSGAYWQVVQFAEVSHAIGTVTSGLPYDVFGYLDSGALAIEKLAWTNGTTRATAITLQDGRYCKSGDKTRLYLGTFYTTSTTATEDSLANRYLWNLYNSISKMGKSAMGTSHTITVVSSRLWNAGAGTQPTCRFVTGLVSAPFLVIGSARLAVTSSTYNASISVYLNGGTIVHSFNQLFSAATETTTGMFPAVVGSSASGLGYNYIELYEIGYDGSTKTIDQGVSSYVNTC